MIYFKKLFEEYKKSNLNHKLPIILGEDEQGKPQFADLIELKNIIMGGTTGSGKSVFNEVIINTLTSIYTPNELNFYLADPKLVELLIYKDSPYLIDTVGKFPEDIFPSFEKLVIEKNKRESEGYSSPYIVIIIDTFSDLMAYAPVEFEKLMQQILSNSSNLGIFAIICDSRTGNDVFTEKLLECFPTKIAFNTSTIESSELLIKEAGAEKLLGRGDMLFLPPFLKKAVRIQAPYISEDEIKEILDKYSK